MKRNQESGLWGADCMISFSSFPMEMLAYEGAIFFPIAVQKTAWGTEMSSEKEGIQQCEH
jgi:hypothetical protein